MMRTAINILLLLGWYGVSNGDLLTTTVTRKSSYCTLSTISPVNNTSQASYNPLMSTATAVLSIIVTPVPVSSVFNDSNVSSGSFFNLELSLPSSGLKQRQEIASSNVTRMWLKADGNTTTDQTQAAALQILDQHLYINGVVMSKDPNSSNVPLAVIQPPSNIQTNFTTTNLRFRWENREFDNGEATFYKYPVGQVDNAAVSVHFGGSYPEGDIEVINPVARPCESVHFDFHIHGPRDVDNVYLQ
jgi:hypothetical protein